MSDPVPSDYDGRSRTQRRVERTGTPDRQSAATRTPALPTDADRPQVVIPPPAPPDVMRRNLMPENPQNRLPRNQQPHRVIPGGMAVVANPQTGEMERDVRGMTPEQRRRIMDGSGRGNPWQAMGEARLGYRSPSSNWVESRLAMLAAAPEFVMSRIRGEDPRMAINRYRQGEVPAGAQPPQSYQVPPPPPSGLDQADESMARQVQEDVANGVYDLRTEEDRRLLISLAEAWERDARAAGGSFSGRDFLDDLRNIHLSRTRED